MQGRQSNLRRQVRDAGEGRADEAPTPPRPRPGLSSRAYCPLEFDSVDATYKVALSRYQDAIEEIRNRQALVAQRRSELSLARQQLADTNVYAPIDGIVQEKRASVGEYLAAGAPVVDIVRMDPLRLRAGAERGCAECALGQDVGYVMATRISISPNKRMRGHAQQTECDGEAAFTTRSLRPGELPCRNSHRRREVVVPFQQRDRHLRGIEKVSWCKTERLEKPVTTGRRSGEERIVAGLNVGDQVESTGQSAIGFSSRGFQ